MIQYEYQVRFNTPAFLGNADQVGQWRTPPFKALLRQWWRLAFAAGQHATCNVDAMRRQEGLLFGVAADDHGGSRKSQVRIRLSCWEIGAEKKATWGRQELMPNAKVAHPEVNQPIGPLLYLGYGPLEATKVSQPGKPPAFATTLKKNAAIQSGEAATLGLAFPTENERVIKTALWLMHHYGSLGGRSRNGWGSFSLSPANDRTPLLEGQLDARLIRDWQDALQLDWPHAIGQDQQGAFVWRTPAAADWKALMRQLAEIKIGLRTQFKFTTGRDAPAPESRHWLSYPVTNHSVKAWRERGKGDFRLPNSLRFKVRSGADNKPYGVIVHVPCAPPAAFRPDPRAIRQVWSQVHRFLDDPGQGLSRISA
jgi:CRISPR-associated protein Cmr1